MSRRRRTLLIALAAAVIGSATLASWRFYVRSLAFPDKFTQVSVGMTRQEVVALLGPATPFYSASVSDHPGLSSETWQSGRWVFIVIFKEDGTVEDRQLFEVQPPTLREQIRLLLGF
jgi:outer membrane protein assembly factor BamE (lipoprotein component of BamABCDE complex)